MKRGVSPWGGCLVTSGEPSGDGAVLIVEKGVEADGREEDIKGV